MPSLLLVLSTSVQTALQPAPAPQPIAAAASLGTILYALDRAAWIASDAMTAKIPRDRLTGAGGWMVERSDEEGTLVVTFYRGEGGAARAFFGADVKQGKVVASRSLPDSTPLTPTQHRLAQARAVASADAVARGVRPCTPGPFNTVVLPSTDPSAPVVVYLLSAQAEASSFPIGGHYRYLIDSDGKVAASRAFSKSCLNMTLPRAAGGQTPAGLFVNHVLDPTPTEAHVFTSLAARLPLFVAAGNRVWKVDGRTITLSDMKPPTPPH